MRIVTSRAGQLSFALDEAFRVAQCRNLTGDEYVFGHWVRVAGSAQAGMTLRADFHDLVTFEGLRSDKVLPPVSTC